MFGDFLRTYPRVGDDYALALSMVQNGHLFVTIKRFEYVIHAVSEIQYGGLHESSDLYSIHIHILRRPVNQPIALTH